MTMDTNTGVVVWRPAIAQSGSTNLVIVQVADDASLSLSAAQSFWTTVLRPAEPLLGKPATSNGAFQFSVTGDAQPHHIILNSTILVDWDLCRKSIRLPSPSGLPTCFKRIPTHGSIA
jgi:hypothetical protein